jgi:hypothetical protein
MILPGILLLILLIGMVGTVSAAERITNGGFETGGLTGWTSDNHYDASIVVRSDGGGGHTGTYYVFMNAAESSYANISQSVNFQNVSALTFYYWSGNSGGTNNYSVWIGTTPYYFAHAPSWTLKTIDTSSYSGTQLVTFRDTHVGGGTDNALRLDDISATSSEIITTYPLPGNGTVINETRYFPFNNTNIPTAGSNISHSLTPGEFGQVSFIIKPNAATTGINITLSALTDGVNTIPKANISGRTVKVWYQAAETDIRYTTTGYYLAPELLLKDDAVVNVNYTYQNQTLRVSFPNGTTKYVDISNVTATQFDETGQAYSNATASGDIQPLSLAAGENKQIMVTTYVPTGTPTGNYTGTITISSPTTPDVTIDYLVRVLPFTLPSSSLDYGLYYNGILYPTLSYYRMDSLVKNANQIALEYQNMKDHGIEYTVISQTDAAMLDARLLIMNQSGMPKDKFYIYSGVPSTDAASAYIGSTYDTATIAAKVANWKNHTGHYGYTDTYFGAIDEGDAATLASQRDQFGFVHDAGGKLFTASYETTDLYTQTGDLLDVGIQNTINSTQAPLWHAYGNKIFLYCNPQSGVENPEVYRQNFGLALWVSGYDGTMEYSYQEGMNLDEGYSVWNDFDDLSVGTKWRDHMFAYPTGNGVVDTIQWEGWREGVDDTRYADYLTSITGNRTNTTEIINADLASGVDMSVIRNHLIDHILAETGTLAGSGSNTTPYQVSTPYTLNQTYSNSTAYAKLTTDINANTIEFTRVDTAPTGQINGDNNTISNLTIDESGSGISTGAGLYSQGYAANIDHPILKNVVFKNLVIVNGAVSGGANSYAMASALTSNCTIGNLSNNYLENVFFDSPVIISTATSDEVGHVYQGVVGTYCVPGMKNVGIFNATVISQNRSPTSPLDSYIGGLAGQTQPSSSGTLTNVYFTGNVSGSTPVGAHEHVGVMTGDGNVNMATYGANGLPTVFYDFQTSTPSTPPPTGSANTSAQYTSWMKNQLLYTNAGWDFTTVWAMSNVTGHYKGYPILRGMEDPYPLAMFTPAHACAGVKYTTSRPLSTIEKAELEKKMGWGC